jgi:cytochrome c
MDFFAWNRIAGAVLGAAICVLVLKLGAEAVFQAEPLEHAAYIVEGVGEVEPAQAQAAAPEPELPDFSSAIPAANIDNGQTLSAPCAICHNWEDDGGNLIGPNLYNVVGREKASAEGFNYSPAFQSLDEEWSYADLFAFLEQPAVFAPGTTMAFAGISNAQDRLDLIAYMRSWSTEPAPLPPPAPSNEGTQTP